MLCGLSQPIKGTDTATTGGILLISHTFKVKLIFLFFLCIYHICYSVKRNLSHLSNIHISTCQTPKMADVVGQAVGRREQSQRELPQVETRQNQEVHNTGEEEDDVEEVSCFKEAVPNGNSQLDLSSQQQRDVTVLVGDTPSPAPSVISIHSELTDGEDEGDDDDPQRCCLSEWVTSERKKIENQSVKVQYNEREGTHPNAEKWNSLALTQI